MTPKEWAAAAMPAWLPLNLDLIRAGIADAIRAAMAREREECARIVINSGVELSRLEIAEAIRARGSMNDE
jgi:nucleoside-diphosphate-sugar epimerase